jgi:hypothetical protein
MRRLGSRVIPTKVAPAPASQHSCRLHDAVIRVYDAAGSVIETHEHTGDFKEVVSFSSYQVAVPAKMLFRDSAFIE